MTEVIKNELFRPEITTPLRDEEAFYFLRTAWKNVLGQEPTKEQLGIVWSQFQLESGQGKKCKNYNYGNIRPAKEQLWTMYACHEYNNQGVPIKYEPPDHHTVFASYPGYQEGAEAYLVFLRDRPYYHAAWDALMLGDAKGFVHGLVSGKLKYFTAPEDKYLTFVLGYLITFNKNYEKFMNYKLPQGTVAQESGKAAEEVVSKYQDSSPEESLSPWDKILLTFKSIFWK